MAIELRDDDLLLKAMMYLLLYTFNKKEGGGELENGEFTIEDAFKQALNRPSLNPLVPSPS